MSGRRLWIPASSVSEARLESVDGDKTISDSRSLVSLPVVLAVRPELKEALAQQNWSTLPGLQSNPAGLDGLNLPGWGGLRLALPLTGDGDASLPGRRGGRRGLRTGRGPAVRRRRRRAAAVRRASPSWPTPRPTPRWTPCSTPPIRRPRPVHAVVTTEQQLFQRAADLPDAGAKLSAWMPPGPAAVADFPGVLLSGDWLSKEQVSAASEFDRFLRKPEQLAKLAKAGFRAEGTTPPSSPVTDFPPLAQRLSFGDAASRAALATRLTAPARDGAVTVVLNQSMPVDEGGRSRLSNVTTALNDRLQVLPPSTSVGLWTFDGVAGRSVTTTGPLGDDVAVSRAQRCPACRGRPHPAAGRCRSPRCDWSTARRWRTSVRAYPIRCW